LLGYFFPVHERDALPPLFGAVSDLAGYRAMYATVGAAMLAAGLLFALQAPPSETFAKEKAL